MSLSVDNLVDQLSTLLLKKKLLLATAESCTGGMIGMAITSQAGSSEIYDRGFITYSDNAKQEMLGVSENIIRHYGAVSSACAEAMALGAIEYSDAEVSVSITGIAGPDGGTEAKPVGLVYIGVAIIGKEPYVTECHFDGSRQDIRDATCAKALSLLIEAVGSI